jgi:hypothetical protein
VSEYSSLLHFHFDLHHPPACDWELVLWETDSNYASKLAELSFVRLSEAGQEEQKDQGVICHDAHPEDPRLFSALHLIILAEPADADFGGDGGDGGDGDDGDDEIPSRDQAWATIIAGLLSKPSQIRRVSVISSSDGVYAWYQHLEHTVKYQSDLKGWYELMNMYGDMYGAWADDELDLITPPPHGTKYRRSQDPLFGREETDAEGGPLYTFLVRTSTGDCAMLKWYSYRVKMDQGGKNGEALAPRPFLLEERRACGLHEYFNREGSMYPPSIMKCREHFVLQKPECAGLIFDLCPWRLDSDPVRLQLRSVQGWYWLVALLVDLLHGLKAIHHASLRYPGISTQDVFLGKVSIQVEMKKPIESHREQ